MLQTPIGALCLGVVLSVVPASAEPDRSTCDVQPVVDALQSDGLLAELGRELFYDPILSGNRNVACATCHHPAFGTSDGVSLSLGDGGTGLGPKRQVDTTNIPEKRIPRNAQSLFNLAYPEFDVMFHDGRVERLETGMIRTPLGDLAGADAQSVLAVQAGFPVLSADEMAGHYSENAVAQAVRRGVLTGPGGARQILADRVAEVPAYRARFSKIFGSEVRITYPKIGRALAAFIAHEWRADDSPFDRYLCQGELLEPEAAKGMDLFYGKAGCSSCHAGRFQTDHGFHSIALPQIGPGKAARFEDHSRDTGRMRVTGDPNDAYKFKTPSLRNVTLTAPYGHSGAYLDLRSMILHHLDPVSAWTHFDRTRPVLPILASASDFEILDSKVDGAAILSAREQYLPALTDTEINHLIAFLHALTDRTGIDGRLGVPESVPSGLPVPNP